jgi:hypothetical protein
MPSFVAGDLAAEGKTRKPLEEPRNVGRGNDDGEAFDQGVEPPQEVAKKMPAVGLA